MKEKSENKSLIKVNDNIFFKIRKFFLKIFKYDISKHNIGVEEISNSNEIYKPDNRNEFLNQLKENKYTNVFNLQRKYENGQLKVSEMSEEEYYKIEELYNKQIEILTNQIKYKKAKLSTN